MNPTLTPIDHLVSLLVVLRELDQAGITLVGHVYSPAAFGSFEIVLGTGHEQAKFSWDGRDSILVAYFRRVQNGTELNAWVHDANISVPCVADVLPEIYSEAVALLKVAGGK